MEAGKITLWFAGLACLISSTTSLNIHGDVIIGGPCSASTDCVGIPGLSSGCYNNRCVCKPNYIVSSSLDDCLPILNSLGDQCQESQQCQAGVPGELSTCMTGRCACNPEAVTVPGQHKCYRKAEEIGEFCEVDIQCQSNLGELSHCRTDGVCDCFEGYTPTPDYKRCVPKNQKVLIGGSCSSNDECSGNPTFTVECTSSSMCACLAGYVTNILMNDCLPIVNSLDSYCSESQQCQQGTPGIYSVCKNSTTSPGHKICKCTDHAVNQPGNEKCFLTTLNVGSPCEIQEQCIATLEQSQCIDGACQCLEYAKSSADGVKCVVEKNEL